MKFGIGPDALVWGKFKRRFRGDYVRRLHGVAAEALAGSAVLALEPALRRTPAGAIFFPGTASVKDPRHVAAAYGRLLAQRNVEVSRSSVRKIASQVDGSVHLVTDQGDRAFDSVVVAAGAWSRDLLLEHARLPMVVERGYLMRYRTAPGEGLSRPVFDTENGLVLSPRPEGVQLSTGTDLTTIGAAPRLRQFEQAEKRARSLISLAERQMESPAVGNRPSTPDGLPLIGRLAKSRNIWIATGHQHVGFSTGPGSGYVLADMISEVTPEIDATAFSPARFGL